MNMNLNLLKIGALSLGIMLSALGNAYPGNPQLEYLGQTSIQNVFSDSDVINFGSCNDIHNNFIHRVQLRVDRAPVEIEDLVIQYGNGEYDRLQVREIFQAGTASRLIDLNGGSRCISKAFVRARTISFGAQGVVSFYGYRNPRITPPNTVNGRFFIGRTMLDYSRDADRILVSRCNGRDSVKARKLQILVQGNDANIEEFVVAFGNGDVANIPVREFFAERTWSNLKDLPGNQRCIREIFVLGRTLNSRYNGGRASVDVYGIR